MIIELTNLVDVRMYVPDVGANRQSSNPWRFEFLPITDGDFESIKRALPADNRTKLLREAVLKKYVRGVYNLFLRVNGADQPITEISDWLHFEPAMSPVLANETERLYQAILEGATLVVTEKND